MRRTVWLWNVVVSSLVCTALLGHPVEAQQGKAQQEERTLTLEKHRFSPAELRVPAHTAFVLTIINKDKEDEEFEISALRLEKIVPGGKTLPVKMPALKPGTYEFVGEFHESTAKGRIIAE